MRIQPNRPTIITGLVLGLLCRVAMCATDRVTRHSQEVRAPCTSVDYAPCGCSSSSYGYTIDCQVDAVENFTAIRDAFARSPIVDHNDVYITLNLALPIPSDILGGKRTKWLDLYCANHSVSLNSIAVDAFASSPSTEEIWISGCDLRQLDFSFLSAFANLSAVNVEYSLVNSLQSMPVLPSLRSVRVTKCVGFNRWYTPSNTPNVDLIDIDDNQDVGDETMDSILDSISHYYATKPLSLWLRANALTRIPRKISALANLNSVRLNNNPIKLLLTGSFDVPSKMNFLGLSYTQLEAIEPGTFAGDYSSTLIDLTSNQLKSFSFTTFEPLLQSMVNNSGSIDIRRNPIKYDCGLSWLLSDNRHLLAKVDGHIENGTRFDQLQPDGLANCDPVASSTFTPPTTSASTRCSWRLVHIVGPLFIVSFRNALQWLS